MKATRTRAVCPGCGSPMHQLDGTVGVLAACEECGGIWVDGTMGMAALTGAMTVTAKRFLKLAAEGAAGPKPAGYRDAASRGERRCPVCREPLEQRMRAEPRAEIDVCAKHGTYFDLRELDAIIFDVEMRHAAHGAAAHVAEAEADYAALQRAAGGPEMGNNGYLDYIIYLLRKN